MNSTPDNEAEPASWRTIAPNTPVFASDGGEVGTVAEVLGWDQEDIFHGLVVQSTSPDDARLISAAHVRSITLREIQTDLTSEQVSAIEPYVASGAGGQPETVSDRFLEVRESE